MSSVNLHIGRIVVHGMPRTGGRHFAIALEEMLRQWAGSGLAGTVPGNAPRAIPSLDAGRFRPGATPEQAAGQIVQAIQTRLDARGAAPSTLGTRSRHV